MQYRQRPTPARLCRRRSSTSEEDVADRAEDSTPSSSRLAARRLPQPRREGAAASTSSSERHAPADQGRQAGQRGRPGGARCSGADATTNARPARPGGILAQMRRAPGPGDLAASSGWMPRPSTQRSPLRPEAPDLNSQQIRFLDLLQNHIAQYGGIEVDRLYEPPFTSLHTDGIDGCSRRRARSTSFSTSSSRSSPASRTVNPPPRASAHDYREAARTTSTSSGTEFWTGGITNPLTVIEQISFLMFSRLLDIAGDAGTRSGAARTKQAVQGPSSVPRSRNSAGRTFKNLPA